MANSVLYGLMNQADLQRTISPITLASAVDRTLLISTTLATLADHNAELDTLLGLFHEDTLDYKLFFEAPNASRLQPLDENGDIKPVNSPLLYDTAFPIRGGGHAWGVNFVAREQMTLEDYSRKTDEALGADVFWCRDSILAALFFPGKDAVGGDPYTWTDPKYGNLSIYGLANGDAIKYRTTRNNVPQTDNHFAAQSHAIDDAHNPFPAIQQTLVEHPTNRGPYVCFVATDQSADIKALADFVPYRAPQILLPGQIATPGVNTAQILDGVGINLPPSATILGSVDRLWIVEWGSIPAGYLLTLATGGPRPLRRRQYPQVTLQGFKTMGEEMDFPYFKNRWIRFAGWGAWNRVGAHVTRIGNASYAMPANLAPLIGQ